MAHTTYDPTEETMNKFRTYRLLFGPCTDQLRDVLRQEVPPGLFATVIQQKKSALLHLTKTQEDLILPKQGSYSGDFSDMDISLLYILLRSITNIKPHWNGWNKYPDSKDRSLSANIERIRQERNDFVHSSSDTMTNTDFSNIWKTLKGAVKDLDGFLIRAAKYEKEVDNLEHAPMDPVLEEELKQELKRQKIGNKELLKVLEDLENLIKEIHKFQRDATENDTDPHLALIEKKLKRWQKEDEGFVETNAFLPVMERVKNQTISVFVGGPGCGKKLTMRHIALKLSEKDCFKIIPLENINDIRNAYTHKKYTTLKKLYVLPNVTGAWSLKEQTMDEIEDMQDTILSILGVDSKMILTCQRSVYNEAKQRVKYFLLDSRNVIDLESEEFRLNVQDKECMIKKHCEKHRLKYVPEKFQNILELESGSMFPELCNLFCSKESFREAGSSFFLRYRALISETLDTIKKHNIIQYAALLICAFNKNMLSMDIEESDRVLQIKNDVCKACLISNETPLWTFSKSLSELCGIFVKESEESYHISNLTVHDVIIVHYGNNFQCHVIEYMTSNFISRNIECEPSCNEQDEIPKIRLRKVNFQCLAKRFVSEIKTFNLFDVFKSQALKSKTFKSVFISYLEQESYDFIKQLFLTVPSIETNPNPKWFYPNFKVISWIIFYGHGDILKFVLDIVEKRGDPLTVVFGHTGTELVRMLKLACFNGSVDIYGIVAEKIKIIIQKKDAMFQFEDLMDAHCCSDFDEQHNKTSVYNTSKQHESKTKETSSQEKTSLLGNTDPPGISCLYEISKIRYPFVHYSPESFIQQHVEKEHHVRHSPLYKAHSVQLPQYNTKPEDFYAPGYTPMTAACLCGHLSLVKAILKQMANTEPKQLLNKVYKDGRTPLEAAIQSGNCVFVENMLTLGCEIEFRTPLYFCMKLKNIEMIETLEKKGANIESVLAVAIAEGDIDIVKKIQDGKSAAPKVEDTTATFK